MTETELQTLHAEISTVRDEEITFAMEIATKLDKMRPLAGDPRYQILADAQGRIDGLRIALELIQKKIDQSVRS